MGISRAGVWWGLGASRWGGFLDRLGRTFRLLPFLALLLSRGALRLGGEGLGGRDARLRSCDHHLHRHLLLLLLLLLTRLGWR